jgi:hypothetical protein
MVKLILNALSELYLAENVSLLAIVALSTTQEGFNFILLSQFHVFTNVF